MISKLKQTVFLCVLIIPSLSCQSGNGTFWRYAISDRESSKGNRVVSYSLTKVIPINEWGAVYHYRALCTKSSVKDGRVFFTTDSATIYSPGMGIILINGHE